MEIAKRGAAMNGTPFVSFFAPSELLVMAREAGFKDAHQVAGSVLAQRYFAGRADGLCPPNNAENLLVAET